MIEHRSCTLHGFNCANCFTQHPTVGDIPGQWRQSDHGIGTDGDRQQDVTVRNSEILTTNCKIGPMVDQPSLNTLHQWFKTHAGEGGKVSEPEILRYTPGSHFAEHEDRDRSQPDFTHVGTVLLIGYSPDAMGGELCENGQPIVRKDPGVERWQWFMAYVPLGTTHSVTELTAGERYCIKQAMYTRKQPQAQPQPDMRSQEQIDLDEMAQRAYDDMYVALANYPHESYRRSKANLARKNVYREARGEVLLED